MIWRSLRPAIAFVDNLYRRPSCQAILTAVSLSDAWEQARQAWRRLASSEGRSEDDDGLASLSDIGVVRRMLDQAELAAVRAARSRGKSWAEIATHLGVTRQSAWERWRDLDDVPSGSQPRREPTVLADEAARMVLTSARERRRASKVLVPNVIGLEWSEARRVLSGDGLVAINVEPDTPFDLRGGGWIVRDQSPESGARVPVGSDVRLWLRGDGDAGVREPRRPGPTPQSAREKAPEPRQAVG
jgi:transposase-like protein